jgi:hypothetical protein
MPSYLVLFAVHCPSWIISIGQELAKLPNLDRQTNTNMMLSVECCLQCHAMSDACWTISFEQDLVKLLNLDRQTRTNMMTQLASSFPSHALLGGSWTILIKQDLEKLVDLERQTKPNMPHFACHVDWAKSGQVTKFRQTKKFTHDVIITSCLEFPQLVRVTSWYLTEYSILLVWSGPLLRTAGPRPMADTCIWWYNMHII